MGGSGTLVCIESNERRVARLRENVPDRDEAPRVRVLHAALGDLTPEDLEAAGLPGLYDAVLIDVPCSNSGVIRRRPEARWRQSDPQLMNEVVAMQTLLLDLALKFVRPGGRIVYSTCSIDARENSGVVDLVLKGLPDVEAFKPHPEFRLSASRMSYPWIDGHDGGGAFRLERVLDA
jgi:16S rRNA (cytosine967-C5)-methyltransferase